MKYIVVLFLIVTATSEVFANCVEESKNFDDCLQCCTDTAAALQIIHKDTLIAQDLAKSCISEQQVSTSSSYEVMYSKYKIDYSTFKLLCKDSSFVTTGQLMAMPYDQCPSVCDKKFRGKK